MDSPRIIDNETIKSLSEIHENELIIILSWISPSRFVEVISMVKSKVKWNFELIHGVLLMIKNDNCKYKIVTNTLSEYLSNLNIREMIDILNVFIDEKFKYKALNKLIVSTKCYLFEDDGDLINIFNNAKLKNKVSKTLSSIKKNINYKKILTIISLSQDDKLDLLEKSLVHSGVKLGNSDDYCEQLRHIFNAKDYIHACEILAINPDIFVLHI